MEQAHEGADKKFDKQIIDFCRHIAGSSKVTAIGVVQNSDANGRVFLQIIAVILNFQPRIMSNIKKIGARTVFVLVVDQWVFERDIELGFLGEAIASKLVFPHSALLGDEYLHNREIALKKRLILETLENLTLNFPALAQHIHIKPEYFLYEAIQSRIRFFPPLANDISSIMKGSKLKNESEELKPYLESLKELEKEGKITFSSEVVRITEKFSEKTQSPKSQLIKLSKNTPRRFFGSFFGVFPLLANAFSMNVEALLSTRRVNWLKQVNVNSSFINPQKYVYFETARGMVSLAENLDIKGFAQKMLLNPKTDNFKIRPIGGILNDVYLIDAVVNGVAKKVLVKRFKDWSNLKWYPLNMWSSKIRSLAVLGQARLAKECVANDFLSSKGFNVPKILHVSNAERLIFMEYIEGENLSEAIKRIAVTKKNAENEDELCLVGKVGQIYAKVHSFDFTLGDTKPENIIVKPDGSVYLLDFEQASEKSDKAWDIAVFLYYCGHYLQPINSDFKAEAIAKAFINSYLDAGGDVSAVKKAGEKKYTRLFSVFTMPATITAIANTCKKAEKQVKTDG